MVNHAHTTFDVNSNLCPFLATNRLKLSFLLSSFCFHDLLQHHPHPSNNVGQKAEETLGKLTALHTNRKITLKRLQERTEEEKMIPRGATSSKL
jgi:hypothetical protein